MATGDIGKRIREARETFRGVGMKQKDLADRIGVSRARLSNWENGMHDPHPYEIINRVAQVLEVPIEFIRDGALNLLPHADRPKGLTKNLVPEPSGKVKVIGRVFAGSGNTEPHDDENFLDVPMQFAREDYSATQVSGDSMMPFLQPSDTVIFKDHEQEKVGHVMVAYIEPDQWVVKKLVYEDGGFRLRSLNPAYLDILPPFKLEGFLVGIVRDDGWERLIRLNPYGLKPSV